MSVTIEELARQLNLAVSTVSKALNGYSDISAATRQRVLETAQAQGYHPNTAARNLRRQRTEKIGVVVNYPINIVDDYLAELIPGAAAAAEQADYNLILYTSVAHHPERISKICRAREVDGLLLLWPPQLERTVALMAEEQMPYIVLPRRVSLPGISYIATDHVSSGRQLTEHLLALGHTRIGFTTYPEVYETNTDRFAGYQAALAAAGIPFDEALVVETRAQDPGNGEAILQTLLTLPEPPTAILCFNDPMAMRVLAAAKARGLRVPEDLSITGHDGILTSAMTTPALTTARQPIPAIGRLAVQTLLAHIANSELPPSQHLLPIQLVVRGSTAERKKA
jgi:DNA-binding LacI/PurR family transcriptional regulator